MEYVLPNQGNISLSTIYPAPWLAQLLSLE